MPGRYVLTLASVIISRKSIWPRASSAWVEELAEAAGVERGAAVGVRDAGDAAVVGRGVAVAVEVEVADVGEVVDAVAVDGGDLVGGGVAGCVVCCLRRGVAYGLGGAAGGGGCG